MITSTCFSSSGSSFFGLVMSALAVTGARGGNGGTAATSRRCFGSFSILGSSGVDVVVLVTVLVLRSSRKDFLVVKKEVVEMEEDFGAAEKKRQKTSCGAAVGAKGRCEVQ